MHKFIYVFIVYCLLPVYFNIIIVAAGGQDVQLGMPTHSFYVLNNILNFQDLGIHKHSLPS